jgi:hypothetical protein
MTEDQIRQELAAVRDAALEDLAATSDAELRNEALEDGIHIKSRAVQLRTSLRESASAALRARMNESKAKQQDTAHIVLPALLRPPVNRIKELIRELTQREPQVGFAFRDGRSQTDEDWQTAYDDLVSMGLIKPEDNGH